MTKRVPSSAGQVRPGVSPPRSRPSRTGPAHSAVNWSARFSKTRTVSGSDMGVLARGPWCEASAVLVADGVEDVEHAHRLVKGDDRVRHAAGDAEHLAGLQRPGLAADRELQIAREDEADLL